MSFTKNLVLLSTLKPWRSFLSTTSKLLGVFFIGVYRTIGSAWLGGACRYYPSCSDYSMQAYQKYSFIKATQLSVRRVCRCRPGGGCGYDPLP